MPAQVLLALLTKKEDRTEEMKDTIMEFLVKVTPIEFYYFNKISKLFT